MPHRSVPMRPLPMKLMVASVWYYLVCWWLQAEAFCKCSLSKQWLELREMFQKHHVSWQPFSHGSICSFSILCLHVETLGLRVIFKYLNANDWNEMLIHHADGLLHGEEHQNSILSLCGLRGWPPRRSRLLSGVACVNVWRGGSAGCVLANKASEEIIMKQMCMYLYFL